MKKCTNFEEQKGASYIWGYIYFGIIGFSCLSSLKACFEFLLICFAREIKGFYQISRGNEVDFMDMMYSFLDEIAMITATLISSCHFKIIVSFCLRRKRSEKAFLKLAANWCKIKQRNNLCHPK